MVGGCCGSSTGGVVGRRGGAEGASKDCSGEGGTVARVLILQYRVRGLSDHWKVCVRSTFVLLLRGGKV